MNKQRVACLYRVSTKQQMIEDDIPAQRNACLDFIAKHPDWEFVGEYSEKGVSGYKTKAKDREVLETLKEDALNNKFDIVLVFLFDRLGRIEEETPYVLKWFVDHGVEMWSVKEGQRTLDNHVDSLLNYITFWQAAGESKKTQIRTKEVKDQMVEEGKYLGCPSAYGYKHISTGEHNKKGREIKKIVIDENESDIVKKIFDLATIKGYGSRRIAKELNESGIPTKRNGSQWAGATVMGILKNTMYKGYFTYGRYATTNTSHGKRIYKNQSECKSSSEVIKELVIISEEQWESAQNIISARANKVKSNIPQQTKSPLLFTGFIYCDECKSRMTLHYSYSHNKRKNGTINNNRKAFYVCYGKDNGQANCKSKGYSSEKIEGTVMDEVYNTLKQIENISLSDITNNKNNSGNKYQKDIKIKNVKIKSIEDDLKLYKGEIIKVLKGASHFTTELLNEQIEEKNNELTIAQHDLKEYLIKIENIQDEINKSEALVKNVSQWIEILVSSDTEAKKMLLSKLIDNIFVNKDDIKIKLNEDIEELLGIGRK